MPLHGPLPVNKVASSGIPKADLVDLWGFDHQRGGCIRCRSAGNCASRTNGQNLDFLSKPQPCPESTDPVAPGTDHSTPASNRNRIDRTRPHKIVGERRTPENPSINQQTFTRTEKAAVRLPGYLGNEQQKVHQSVCVFQLSCF